MAILTGSHVYGTPHASSDLDLVVLLDEEQIGKLRELYKDEDSPYVEITTGQMQLPGGGKKADLLDLAIRFGPLNLICTSNPVAYQIWAEGTATLKDIKPVPRNVAVAWFQELREARL